MPLRGNNIVASAQKGAWTGDGVLAHVCWQFFLSLKWLWSGKSLWSQLWLKFIVSRLCSTPPNPRHSPGNLRMPSSRWDKMTKESLTNAQVSIQATLSLSALLSLGGLRLPSVEVQISLWLISVCINTCLPIVDSWSGLSKSVFYRSNEMIFLTN